jgi:hypothetical protein
MAKSKEITKADEQEKELVTEQSESVATQEKPLTEHQKFQICNLTSGNRMSMKDAIAFVRKNNN